MLAQKNFQKGFAPIILIVGILVILGLGGAYYLGKSQQPPTISSDKPSPSPSELVDSDSAKGNDSSQSSDVGFPITPNIQKRTTVSNSAEKYGFTKSVELPGVGVKLKVTDSSKVEAIQPEHYSISNSSIDSVGFFLKQYDGGGRRAWFLKEYPFMQEGTGEKLSFIEFFGKNHNGYIAFKAQKDGFIGSYYYFTAINAKQMLVISGSNGRDSKVYFANDIERFKSFLTAVELQTVIPITFEEFSGLNEIYRWSDTRKTIWSDSSTGLKITSPEWTESRFSTGRDANGKIMYSDWGRMTPKATVSKGEYYNEDVTWVSTDGSYTSGGYLIIFESKYMNMNYDDVVKEVLPSAGFCKSEWKITKEDCTNPDYCYTKDEVIQNLQTEKTTQISGSEGRLYVINQSFSDQKDCRTEREWLIKAKNGKYILTNIHPNETPFGLEVYP